MSSDFVYVRTPARLLGRAEGDRALAMSLMVGRMPLEPGDTTTVLALPWQTVDALWAALVPGRDQLAGDAPAMGDLVGVALVGLRRLRVDIDTGYGAPHALDPAEVVAASAALAAGDVTDPRLREALGALRAFYAIAAGARQGVLITPT